MLPSGEGIRNAQISPNFFVFFLFDEVLTYTQLVYFHSVCLPDEYESDTGQVGAGEVCNLRVLQVHL